MKSNEITLSNSRSCAQQVLQEVEHASAQARLNQEQTNLMRLLAEEMISMTGDILQNCKRSLWMEWEGLDCELHLTASAPMDKAANTALIGALKAKTNTPVKGMKNRISILLAGMLTHIDAPELNAAMGPGFLYGAYPDAAMPVWSLAAYEKSRSEEEKQAGMEGMEKTVLNGIADDIVVSSKANRVELVVKKRFDAPLRAALPTFTGLSHICIFVDDMEEAVDYYRKLLGAIPDHCLSHWKNRGFFKAGGFLDEAADGDVSIAFVNVPGTKLTLELMQYHYPQGRKIPVFFAANDVSGARHVALKIANIDEAFLHIRSMPDTHLINRSQAYRVFQISKTDPSEVHFFDQDVGETDERNVETAKILSQVRYFYFIDKYGLQWEFEQGHSDIGD